MARIDVFNGDADGICALQQLRLAEPVESTLVTGVKRDIALLRRVAASSGDVVTVLDISLDKNREELVRLLDAGARVQYFDHHFAGEIPDHAGLESHIDTAADVCTSLLVNRQLDGAFLPWAVVAAFGDNLYDAARAAAAPMAWSDSQLHALERLGMLINYNGYGASLDDLYFAPDALYRAISPYADPFDFIAESEAYLRLSNGYDADMEAATAAERVVDEERIAVTLLPDAAWARRISGVLGNEQAREAPNRAHALMTEMADGTYRVSVRAPLSDKQGADELCMQFPTGGGRKAAAGINALPADRYQAFIDAFRDIYGT
jgi:hypothetical protein